MPVFDTAEPISVTLDLSVGDVRITASDRADTVVEVRPSNESDESDVQAAAQTRVDYANGTLLVKGPKNRAFDFSRKSRSVDVTVELPAGSRVQADSAVGDFRATGRLGECRFKSAVGHIQLERTGPLHVDTSGGHVTVERVDGNADVSTGTGKVRIGQIAGTAVVKNSNGHTEIGTATGEARIRAANGDISVGQAVNGVDAKTANGGIRVGEVVRGTVTVKTSTGDLEIGIREGTAAWLDVSTGYGRVHNSLADAPAEPSQADEKAEVHAHTSYGDVTVRRS